MSAVGIAVVDDAAARIAADLHGRIVEFLESRRTSPGLLLVKAKPGAGKTSATLKTLIRLGIERRVRSVYFSSSKYDTIRDNLEFAAPGVVESGLDVSSDRDFKVLRAEWRRGARLEERRRVASIPLLLAHTRHVDDTNVWDLDPGDHALLSNRDIVVFDESPLEAWRQRFVVRHADLRRLDRMLTSPRLRKLAELARHPAQVSAIERNKAMRFRHALGDLREAIRALYRGREVRWLGMEHGLPPGVLEFSLPPSLYRSVLFTIFNVWRVFEEETRNAIADLLCFLFRGGVVQGGNDGRDAIHLVGRRDLSRPRQALGSRFLCVVLDATGEMEDYTREESDGNRWTTAGRSLLLGLGQADEMDVDDDRRQRARCELVKPETSRPHTLACVRRRGRAMRSKLRRGIAAYVRSLLDRKPDGKVAVLATGRLLAWLYGRFGRYYSKPWASDPRAAARCGIRMAIGAHPKGEWCPEIRVEFLHGVRGSNSLREFDALLILMPAFAPRPVEAVEEDRWIDEERRAFEQAIERLRARDEGRSGCEIVLWGTGRTVEDLRGWDYPASAIREHESFDDLLCKLGHPSRSAGRGPALSSRALQAIAPEYPFSVAQLRRKLELLLESSDQDLLSDFEGFEGLADEDFEKGVLKSALADLGIATDGTVQQKRLRLDRKRHGLSSAAQKVLDGIRSTVPSVLRKYPYPRKRVIDDPKALAHVARLACRRWELLAPLALRTLVLELLARIEPMPRGGWHRDIHRALHAAGFIAVGNEHYRRPYPASF